jgi:hypothetical protein
VEDNPATACISLCEPRPGLDSHLASQLPRLRVEDREQGAALDSGQGDDSRAAERHILRFSDRAETREQLAG